MIKFLKKKLLESIIKDVTNELPNVKEKLLLLLDEKKELVIEKIKEAVKEKLLELAKGI